MHLRQLLKNIREPPENSMVGHMIGADGRVMRNMPFVILFNLAWLFFYPAIARLSFMSVILPTIISVPFFIYLHLCTHFYGGPAAIRLRYILGIFLLGFAVTYFNLAGLGISHLRVLQRRLQPADALLVEDHRHSRRSVHPRDHTAGCPQGSRAELRAAGGAARHFRDLHGAHYASTGAPSTQPEGNHAARDAGRTRAHRPRSA